MSTVKTGVVGAGYVGTATCPVATEPVTGLSIQVVAQAVLDDAAYTNAVLTDGLKSIYCYELDANKVIVQGAGSLLQSGTASSFAGLTTIVNNAHLALTLDGTSTLTTAAGAVITLPGTTNLTGHTYEADAVYLTDTSQTIASSGGQRYVMLTAPAAQRTITLDQSPAPADGDWMEVLVLISNGAFGVDFKREGSADYVASIPPGVGGNSTASVKFKAKTGVWRLAPGGSGNVNSGADS